MKKNYFIILSALIFCLAFSAHLGIAIAQENAPLSSVNFPIPELGNCANKQECKAYCNIDENMRQCLNFAEKQGLFSEKKIEKDRKILEIMETTKGPGGCANKIECDMFCRNPENVEECIIFGKEHGLIPPEEIKEAEGALKAIRKGFKPPPCQGKEECDIYCSQPEHMEKCIAFGEAAGFISKEDAKMVRKTEGKGPGDCRGKQECDAYCQNPDNMQECMEFGLKYGLMNPEEEKGTRMMLEAMRKGFKPPPCNGKEECDIYCSQPEHMEECIAFGEAAGFIDHEEANRAKEMRKMGMDMGPGPGNCQSEQECKEFCDNPENMKECLEFAVKAGLISEDEAGKIKKMDEMDMGPGPGGCQTREQCDTYCQNPDNMRECMEFGKKMGIVDSREFERMEKMSHEIQHNGPGGCQTPQECKTYCDNSENMEECIKFNAKMGLMKPAEAEVIRRLGPEGQGGPGGCIGREECKKYCMEPEHTEECIDFFLEQKIMMPEDANRMREIRQIAPPMQIMPDNMMPFDIENMPIEKIMELMPPEMKEKFKDFPQEEIKKAITTYKMETMLLPERDIRDIRDMPMMEQGIPMQYDEKMQMQMQTQMFQENRMPMIMPDNMMPNDMIMPEKREIRIMPPDIENMPLEKLKNFLPSEIKEKMELKPEPQIFLDK